MDNRAIGVFDSGLGGLTAVKELHKILPNEKLFILAIPEGFPMVPEAAKPSLNMHSRISTF